LIDNKVAYRKPSGNFLLLLLALGFELMLGEAGALPLEPVHFAFISL
jgi:hypothetical protein